MKIQHFVNSKIFVLYLVDFLFSSLVPFYSHAKLTILFLFYFLQNKLISAEMTFYQGYAIFCQVMIHFHPWLYFMQMHTFYSVIHRKSLISQSLHCVECTRSLQLATSSVDRSSSKILTTKVGFSAQLWLDEVNMGSWLKVQ